MKQEKSQWNTKQLKIIEEFVKLPKDQQEEVKINIVLIANNNDGFGSSIEKQIIERQLAEIRVLSCNGDAEGKHLPTQILLQLDKEIKWYEQTKLNKE